MTVKGISHLKKKKTLHACSSDPMPMPRLNPNAGCRCKCKKVASVSEEPPPLLSIHLLEND